jgi:DNA polymerase-3 subunit delta'
MSVDPATASGTARGTRAGTTARTDAGAASGWDAVIGQDAVVAALRAAVADDALPHAILLVGARHVGQDALARALTASIVCGAPPARGMPCGGCEACGRVARGVHPALEAFEREGAAHLVEDVRGTWIPSAMRALPDASRRVLRVIEADRMNEAAQNAFLKVLEEPPASVVWVLEAEDEARLLDTVVSRCRRLDLAPWGPEELGAHARSLGIAEARIAAVVRAAMGSPQRVTDLADADVAAARERHLGLVDELVAAGPGVVVPLAKELVAWAKGRSAPLAERNAAELERLEEAFGVENGRGWPPGVKQRITKRFERAERAEQQRSLGILLDDLASWLRDLVAVTAGAPADALVNAEHVGALRRDALAVDVPMVLGWMEGVSRCRAALARNGAPELHLERLLMAIAVGLYARRVRAA